MTHIVIAVSVVVVLVVLLVRDVRAAQRFDATLRAELAAGVTYVWRIPPSGVGYLERIPAPAPVVTS